MTGELFGFRIPQERGQLSWELKSTVAALPASLQETLGVGVLHG